MKEHREDRWNSMQVGKNHMSAPPSDNASFPYFDDQPGITLNDLLHHTGFSIKVRFLLALTLIAILPSIILVVMLGDPTGSERQAALGAALLPQAQAQAMAINQTLVERQARVTSLAQTSLANEAGVLTAAQSGDQTSLAWLIVDTSGFIFAAGNHQQMLVHNTLTTVHLVSDPSALLQLIQSTATATGASSQMPALGNDTTTRQVWIAFAAPMPSTRNRVLLAIFSLPELLHNIMMRPNNLNGSACLLLDQNERIAARAGTLATGQPTLATAPNSIAGIRLNTSTLTSITADPLTGHNDLALGSSVPALNGQYIFLVDQNTTLATSNRSLFTGRNAPLLLLGVFVMVVLVATWIALPIIRPIRRATRVIETTTADVRKLAQDARMIAEDHMTGTTILSGASKRLSSRRQALMRDTMLIAHLCQDSLPRLHLLHRRLQEARDKQALEELRAIYQHFQQIHTTTASIADELNKDTSLDQLDQAMVGAREIAKQFEAAGKQLEAETEHLETAAKSLI